MQNQKLPLGIVAAYAGPALGCGYMYLLVSLYVMKYSTDVLLIAPALMGIIFSISRLLDAISDPIVGYLSDRTRSSLGRRRTWMLASILPVAAAFFMIFKQPEGLAGTGLNWWMAMAIIGFYLVITFCFIPHMSLGAELTSDAHQRNRLFGWRHAAYTFGSILALFSLQVFLTEEQQDREILQATVSKFALLSGIGFAALVLYAIWKLSEQLKLADTLKKNVYGSLRDVWRNPHARLLYCVSFIENIGFAAITVLTLYITEYVLHQPTMAAVFILCYMVPSAGLAPLWPQLARSMGKARLWMYSMLLTALAFGSMFPVLYFSGPLQMPAMLVLIFMAGVAAGCGGTMGPSVQSDVIDFDELHTGERKEGTYFAVWNFIYKSAYGVMLLLTGFALQATAFAPGTELPDSARLVMIFLYSILPLVCYLLGAWLFSKFALEASNTGLPTRHATHTLTE